MRVITGTAKGIRLNTPKGLKTRPTADRVKEALFSIIQFDIYGKRVLDLFAGTGQLGIEALSRGAKEAVFVDGDRDAVQLVKGNLQKTKLEGQVFQADYLQFLSTCRKTFDFILLDPPYGEKFLENAIKRISEIDILAEDGIIICESPVGKDLTPYIPKGFCQKQYQYGHSCLVFLKRGEEEL